MSQELFRFSRRVHFYETDQMGVVHHTNYLRYFEEARVAWYNQGHVICLPVWEQNVMAVLETNVTHKRPLKFNDKFEVQMQTKNDRTRFYYEYKILKDGEVCAYGWTKHVLLDKQLTPTRPPEDLLKLMEKEPWIETWL
jgi:acyl-CoA thioester hydrolase